MKKILLTATLFLTAVSLVAQTVARMSDLTPQQKEGATDLILTGQLSTVGNSDFRQLRDLCHRLKRVDLSHSDVLEIPKNAFHSRHRLQQVILPHTLHNVGTQAFFACDSLQSIVLPASTATVADAAFLGCKGLESLIIEGAPSLGEFAFARCNGLRTITVRSAIPPRASASTFEGVDVRRCQLSVPKGSEDFYRKAEGWNVFFGNEKAGFEICRPEKCIVPNPEQLEVHGIATPLLVKQTWIIEADSQLDNEKKHALRILANRTGVKQNGRKGKIHLRLGLDNTLGHREAYTLRVTAEGIDIMGKSPAGVFYGLMTLECLLAADGMSGCCDVLPQMVLKDAPRTDMRELMVDPARIFIPFEELKAFIPEMARYKLNALHLHLVDDQAWRIEIKKYPELTAKASSRVGMDDMLIPIEGYYTQDQMRELVAFAASYHVDIIPEIEMPGHEVAAIHVFPELTCGAKQLPIRTTCGVSNELLCPGKEFTYEFLGNVFAELADVFPSEYVHLGGDEAGNPALGCWTNCPDCQTLKRRLDITTTDRSENWRLQEFLFGRVIDTLRTKYGKTPMFWYETDFKNIPEGCVTFAWRHDLTKAAAEAAIRNNARIVLCPGEHCYLDYPMARGDMPEVNWGMPVTSLQQTYKLDPAWNMGDAFERENLLGVAGTLWSECINSTERIYYQAYPRALALAEAAWSRPERRSWEDFRRRIMPVLRDMHRRGISYSMEF